MLRALLVVTALLAACSPAQPPAPEQQTSETTSPGGVPLNEAPDPERDAMLAALAPRVRETIGVPVSFTVSVKRTDGDWGWIVATPWTPEGAQIDWSETSYAGRAENGVMDPSGATYALLKMENGAWRVVDVAVAPTDLAWEDWPQRYGAPASLFQTR